MPRDSPDRTVDELLVLACQTGSRAALGELFARWQPRLLAHAGHLLGRGFAERADDVCQEAWIAIQKGLPRLREPRRFGAWAYSIVTRRVADHLRAQDRRDRVTAEVGEETANRAAAGDDQDHESRETLRRALDALAAEDRALLRLFYLEELTVAETAEALGVPAGTVKSRLFAARQRLRETMRRM
jgi:RNA polymerase sigma-70 factor (ECF subfamily)